MLVFWILDDGLILEAAENMQIDVAVLRQQGP